MKKTSVLFFILIVLISCCKEQKVEKTIDFSAEKNTINGVLDNWHKNAAETNFEKYFNAMTKESVFIGTDASENWKNSEFKDFSKPFFVRGKAWNFTSVQRNIYINSEGDFAWFDELLDTWMGICRGSGVLIKKDDQWKIEHYVLSVTVPNEDINEVIKVKKEKDSIFLNKLKKRN